MQTYLSRMPACVEVGCGCRKNIGDLVKQRGAKRVLLFSDKGIVDAGLTADIEKSVKASGADCEMAGFVDPEPTYLQVQEVCDASGDYHADLVVAVGGGSVLDTAKLYTLLHDEHHTVKQLLKNPLLGIKRLPSVLVPTTCGTGSEATPNSIVAVPEDGVKVGIVNPQMLPDHVLLDAELLLGLPAPLIASTGVDAMAHAVECYTSNKANLLSDAYALYAAKLLFHNIRAAYQDPANLKAKESMLVGAYYGGASITASGTTAVHALSYPLGGSFHIPHGVSNAILFAPVMAFNLDACEQRLAQLCDAVNPGLGSGGTGEKATWLINEIASIVKDTNIPSGLLGFGVKTGDLDFLVDAASKVKRLLDNNCKPMNHQDIRNIYQGLLS